MLLLLSNANLEAQHIPFLSKIFTGKFSDFNEQWYNFTGEVVVGSMVLNMFMPIFLEMFFYFQRWAIRKWDQLSHHGTKCKSIAQYIEVYGGAEFEAHFRYSNVLMITYVTMLYGTSMPILFVIAAVSFLIKYYLDIYMLHYVFTAPPTYDETLNLEMIEILKFAPLLLLGFGFW